MGLVWVPVRKNSSNQLVLSARGVGSHLSDFVLSYVGSQVYFGAALHPDASKLYHACRCLPSPSKKGFVGLDWYPEDLNLHIKRDVTSHISRPLICKTISEYPLRHAVHAGLTNLIHEGRKGPEAKLKKFDTDVASIVRLLNEKIGRTWKDVTRKKSNSDLNLTTRATKHALPWETMAKAMTHGSGGGQEHLYDWVARTVHRLAPWHQWKP